jgi:VWFA-related protein
LRRLLFVVTVVAGSAHFFFLPGQTGQAGQTTQTAQPTQTAQENAQASPTAQKPASGDLVLKSTVNRVVLDVVVTDSNGRPVRGLTAKDFSVAEDGRPQEILAFDVHSLETASDFAKLPPLPANTFVNIPTAPERGPLYVLLLDLVNSENADEPYARRELLKFLREKPKGTRVAIFVLSDGLHLAQGFTDDEKQLYAVLDPANPRPHIPRIFLEQKNFGKGDVGMMVSVVTNIGQFLDGLPGRKNLLWFSGDFPLTFSPTDDVKSYQDEIKGALDTLAQAQVAVYPVDIRGVSTENAHGAAGSTGNGGVTSDYHSGGAPAGSGGATEPIGSASADSTPFANVPHAGGDQGNSLLMQSYMVQDEVAKTTGGRAFHSNNGLKDLLEAVVDDGANYYTLTYSPSNHNFNGAARAIRVELANRSYQLAYRRSYYGTDLDSLKTREEPHGAGAAEPAATRKLGDSLFANMRHGAPMAHQLYFRAQIHVVGTAALATPEQMANLQQQTGNLREHGKNRAAKKLPPVQLQSYVVDYNVMAPKPVVGTGSAPPLALEIAAAAYDADGQMLNGAVDQTNTANATGSTGASKPGMYRAQQQIDVPVSATSIRVAVRDISTDRIGAMEVALPLAAEAQAQATAPGAAKPN